MARSRNYSLLEEAWKGWRDATGKKMRTLFEEYVSLHNEAIRDAGMDLVFFNTVVHLGSVISGVLFLAFI